MKIEQIILKISQILNISQTETFNLISNVFENKDSKNSPDAYLIDLLGYENIELIFEIIANKEFFQAQELKTDEITYIEHICKKQLPIYIESEKLISVKNVENYEKYFKYEKFNPVQSEVFDSAYNSDQNILISAPTGAGKTDVALLTILRCLKNYKNGQIIYIVPVKALATEIARKYSSILPGVIEYTGDTEISPTEANKAKIIICTPEKFDVSTRRLCQTFLNIKLLIIDEIHLLEDERGPVLESIVARILNLSILQQSIIRIVGLSATLPNYREVGIFIKAEKVFNFDQKYRPVPLETHIVGFKNSAKKVDEINFLINQVNFFKNLKKQVLIFVSSRPKTEKTAKILLENFESTNVGIKKSKTGLTPIVEYLVNNGIGIHHAGLPRKDRLAVEQLFRERKLDVLVSTSTLAWGVNLPAHAVFIYGTTFYNPAKAKFDDLGICDVLQIFGRAGRPQYDTEGKAYLITKSNKIDHYLKLIKRSNDIESKMLYHVTDNICAEIYLQNIKTVSSALIWIKNTFLYIRVQKNPALYGLLSKDVLLEEQALTEYICLSILRLESIGLIEITKPEANYNTWSFKATFYGRICSVYYLKHETMNLWLEGFENIYNEISLLKLLFLSQEFESISLRPEESQPLSKMCEEMLIERIVDFEFDDSIQDKLLVLILAHINYKKPSLFSLQCDTTYIVDNLERMFSAFQELSIYKKSYDIAEITFILGQKIKKLRIVKKELFEAEFTKIGSFAELKVFKTNENLLENFDKLNISSSKNNLLSELQNNISKTEMIKNEIKLKNYEKDQLIFNKNIWTVFVKANNKIVNIFEFKNFLQEFIFINYIDSLKKENINFEIEIYGSEYFIYQKILLNLKEDNSMSGLYKFGMHSCEARYSLMGIQHSCKHFQVYSEFYEKLIHENFTKLSDKNNLDNSKNNLSLKVNNSKNNLEFSKDIYNCVNLQTFIKSNINSKIYTNKFKYIKNSDFFKELENKKDCDLEKMVDIKFNCNFSFIIQDIGNLNESLKLINQIIFNMSLKKPHTIICPSKQDVESTIRELNTLNCLKEDFVESNVQYYTNLNVKTFKDAKFSKNSKILIFKSMRSKNYYFIYEVLKMCEGKEVIIFEQENFIEYFKDITREF